MEKRYFIFVKKILVPFMAAVLMVLMIVSTSFTKAEAIPENLEDMLDETSCTYYDSVMRQTELQGQIASSKAQIEDCNEQINGIKDRVLERMKYSYTHEARMMIEVFIGAENLRDLFGVMDMLDVINERDMRLLNKFTKLKEKLKEETATLEASQAELDAQVTKAKEAYDKAQQLMKDARAAEEGYAAGVFLPANTGNEVADRALREQGKPYIWGACGPKGFDCSGLVSYAICGQYGNRLGTTTTFMGWPRLSEPEVGCICTTGKHCGIYVGNGMMCHAPTEGQVVCCTTVPSNMIFVKYPG